MPNSTKSYQDQQSDAREESGHSPGNEPQSAQNPDPTIDPTLADAYEAVLGKAPVPQDPAEHGVFWTDPQDPQPTIVDLADALGKPFTKKGNNHGGKREGAGRKERLNPDSADPDLDLARDLVDTTRYGLLNRSDAAWFKDGIWAKFANANHFGVHAVDIAKNGYPNGPRGLSSIAPDRAIRRGVFAAMEGLLHDRELYVPAPSFGVLPLADSVLDVHADGGYLGGIRKYDRTDGFTFKLPYPSLGDSLPYPAVTDAFLSDCTRGDEDFKLWLWWIIGEMLFAENTAQRVFMLVGRAGSGKSTLLALLTYLLGEFAHALDQTALWTGHFPFADVQGRRMLTIDELRPNKFTEQVFNQLTSGATLMIERKYQERQPYTYRGHLLFTCNEPPAISNAGLQRRLVAVPFTESATADGRADANLLSKMQKEAASIVYWAHFTWEQVRETLPTPRRVVAWTEQITTGQDSFRQWFDACVDRTAEVSEFTKSGDLFNSYRAFTPESEQTTRRTFSSKLTGAGVEHIGHSVTVRYGVRIKTAKKQ